MTKHCWITSRRACKTPCAILLLTLLTAGGLSAVEPTKYSTKELVYRNEGRYVVNLSVRWNRNGSNCEADPFEDKSTLGSGAARTANLAESGKWKLVHGKKTNCSLPIPPGEEVWLKVYINSGEVKSCRKDNDQMIYDPAGGKVKYVTAGTTTLDNRCTIDAVPDTL
jgi:hypothetical protein